MSDTKGVTVKKPRKTVFYKGNQYDLHPGPNGSYRHAENWFLWIVFFFILLVVGALVISSIWWPQHAHYVPVVVQSTPTTENTPDGPFVFKLHNFASKRSRRTECKTGEVFDSAVGMCAPRIIIPNPYDSSLVDGTVATCSSFFHNMCGRWIDQHMNEDRYFSYGYYRNRQMLQDIITSAPLDDGIGKMYASCENAETHLSLQESRLEYTHIYESIAGELRGYGDLPVVFAKLARQGYTSPFSFSIERHPLEPRVVPLITWDGVTNVTFPMVSTLFESSRGITQNGGALLLNKIDRAWKVLQALQLHNTEPPEEIVDYVGYISSQQGLQQDLISFKDLPQWHTPYEDRNGWKRFFQAYGGFGLRFVREQTFWVIGRPYLEWLMTKAVPSFEILDWKAYVEFCILHNTHQFTPSLPHNVYFKKWDAQGPVGPQARIYHRIPRANTTHLPFHQRNCVDIVHHLVPGLVARQFMTRAFPDAARNLVRREVFGMVERIVAGFKEAVETTSWLANQDKQRAIEKLDSIIIRVAEPDEWEPEPFSPALHHERWDHNLNLIRRYRVQRNLELWHRDMPNGLNRSAVAFFAAPLSTVNAYYSGPTNTITILAGILQPPFYDTRFSNVAKHAIIGSVVAHELSHALDPHGVHWDAAGNYNLAGLFSPQVMEAFQTRLQCVVREFGPTPNGCNASNVQYGEHTLGEDVADLGIRLAYKAYFEKTAEGRNAPLVDKQRFFMIFAQAWCAVYDVQHRCESVLHDVHAVPEYRVDKTLTNLPEFQQAFSCRPDMAMYRAPGEECKVYGD